MRVVLALACLLAVASAGTVILTATDAVTHINGVAVTTKAAAGLNGAGAVAKVTTNVAYAVQGTQMMWARTATGCTAPTAAEKAQVLGWTDSSGVAIVYLDINAIAAGDVHICVSVDGSTFVQAQQGAGPTDIVMTVAAPSSPTLTTNLLKVDPATVVYYGQTIQLASTATTFAAGDMLAMGDTTAVAFKNGVVWPAAAATQDVVVKGTADATYKYWGIAAAKFTATENVAAAQQLSSADLTFMYKHATLNSTLTSAKVNGGNAETKAAVNYTQGANFSFLLTNTIQGNDYYVVAVPTVSTGQKTCQQLIDAGMYVNATQGTQSPTWMAANVGVYEIYAKSKAAGYTVACTKQMFGTVNVVAPPPPPPTPAPTPAPTPVAPAPAPVASTTGTSSASAVRGGLLAAFACVLAGLGVSAAF